MNWMTQLLTAADPEEMAALLEMLSQAQTEAQLQPVIDPDAVAALGEMTQMLPLLIGIILLFTVLWRVILGLVARRVTSNRGRKGGFWWGFFMGFIGIIVAAVRPKE